MLASRPKTEPSSISGESSCSLGQAAPEGTSRLRHGRKAVQVHASSAVIVMLFALQWLHWWTFLIALVLFSSVVVHLHLVIEPAASGDPSHHPDGASASEPRNPSHLARAS
jgi:hypothetical protein